MAPVLQSPQRLDHSKLDEAAFLGWDVSVIMVSNITDQVFWSSDTPLAEPHFDEEATLLSARRVVPIKKVAVKKPGFSRPWVFGFALAGALLLGVSVTALYYS